MPEKTENLFEYATRTKLRFDTTKGSITVEQLWDVPLRSSDGFNLDQIARTCNLQLKNATEESFVSATRSPLSYQLETKLEVVKHVIAVKLEEEATAKRRSEAKVEKDKLLKILAEKQEGKLTELSEKELQKRIAALEI